MDCETKIISSDARHNPMTQGEGESHHIPNGRTSHAIKEVLACIRGEITEDQFTEYEGDDDVEED